MRLYKPNPEKLEYDEEMLSYYDPDTGNLYEDPDGEMPLSANGIPMIKP